MRRSRQCRPAFQGRPIRRPRKAVVQCEAVVQCRIGDRTAGACPTERHGGRSLQMRNGARPFHTRSLSSPVTVLCWLILKEIELPNCQRSNANVSFAANSCGEKERLVRRGTQKIFANNRKSRLRDAFPSYAIANSMVRAATEGSVNLPDIGCSSTPHGQQFASILWCRSLPAGLAPQGIDNWNSRFVRKL